MDRSDRHPTTEDDVRPGILDEAAVPARGDKRERVLEAALELFTDRGFHGTPMPLVAERAGVAAGTIYRYFESKEALVNALFQEWHGRMSEELFGDFPWDEPLRQQFHLYWQRAARFAFRHPKAYSFLNLHFHAPYLDDRSRESIEQHWQRGREYFGAASEQQVTKALPADLLVLVLDGVFTGMFRCHVLGMVEINEELIQAVEECAWAAIRR